mmetsp:Transcript_34345/g.79289  ORF Transcript_34345/g.79289 Transcript_34345/m.79289 type:complete len:127 (-) Transcript_34345:521-901(-)
MTSLFCRTTVGFSPTVEIFINNGCFPPQCYVFFPSNITNTQHSEPRRDEPTPPNGTTMKRPWQQTNHQEQAKQARQARRPEAPEQQQCLKHHEPQAMNNENHHGWQFSGPHQEMFANERRIMTARM